MKALAGTQPLERTHREGPGPALESLVDMGLRPVMPVLPETLLLAVMVMGVLLWK